MRKRSTWVAWAMPAIFGAGTFSRTWGCPQQERLNLAGVLYLLDFTASAVVGAVIVACRPGQRQGVVVRSRWPSTTRRRGARHREGLRDQPARSSATGCFGWWAFVGLHVTFTSASACPTCSTSRTCTSLQCPLQDEVDLGRLDGRVAGSAVDQTIQPTRAWLRLRLSVERSPRTGSCTAHAVCRPVFPGALSALQVGLDAAASRPVSAHPGWAGPVLSKLVEHHPVCPVRTPPGAPVRAPLPRPPGVLRLHARRRAALEQEGPQPPAGGAQCVTVPGRRERDGDGRATAPRSRPASRGCGWRTGRAAYRQPARSPGRSTLTRARTMCPAARRLGPVPGALRKTDPVDSSGKVSKISSHTSHTNTHRWWSAPHRRRRC